MTGTKAHGKEEISRNNVLGNILWGTISKPNEDRAHDPPSKKVFSLVRNKCTFHLETIHLIQPHPHHVWASLHSLILPHPMPFLFSSMIMSSLLTRGVENP